ncbi:NADH dehydrogenase [Kwoniella heveanensis BCC8398]|uniref:NADH dehydrogenase n=1 Tax=Kwoniella heveanensis BCC8398 TaxID=1296120 RepID=A0A1B9H0U8_9TREE|nr:NADH dehydrogenase [Kwoniella heveanensis BCC8398]
MITRRLASTVSVSVPPTDTAPRKIVLVGAGFLGSYIAKALVADPRNRVLLVSRNPQKLHSKLSHLGSQILPPHSTDLTSSSASSSLRDAFKDASAVVSMVGLLTGSEKTMDLVQRQGTERVAEAAREEGVKRVVGISAIGADEGGITPYWRTKALGEKAILENHPTGTIIRPSIVFGPGDSFFNRFAILAKYLPFLPVFGGGVVRFQPVYAGDIARAVEICCRDDEEVVRQVGGRIIEAGGPDVFTYREIMQLVLRYSGLEGRRAILSLPYWVGTMQGLVLEKLPENIFTLTRDQVAQLRSDNIVSPSPPLNSLSFQALLSAFPSSLPTSSPPGEAGLTSVEKVLPTYLGDQSREAGKRTHGRRSSDAPGAFEDVKRMSSGKDKGGRS